MGHTLKIGLGLIFASLCFGQVTVRTICSSGCQYTPSQIQTAVNNADPGDIITIDPASGASTVTGLELPVKTNPNHLYITIRSSSIYNLPGNTRVSPVDPNLATITYTYPGYLTMFADATASFYRFEGIKFTIVQGDAPYNMIQFGRVVEGRTFDNQVWQLPHDFEFDRCVFAGYVGKPGPYRAISANMGRLTVTNSYFTEIKGTNAEAQDIGGWNSFGPFYFRNNHFEASAMETIFGGAQPNISGVRATDLQFLGNEYYRPWVWRIRGFASVDVQAQPPTGSGVCLSDSRGGEWWLDSTSTVASGNNTAFNCDSTGTWQPVTEIALSAYWSANTYHVTTNGSGAPTGTCTDTSYYYKDAVNVNYYHCSGSGGSWVQITLGTWVKGVYQWWFQKNHFELKNAQRALVEGNYLHQSWLPASLNQHGACILLNQVDNASDLVPPLGEPAAVIANVTIRYNHCDNDPWGISDGYIGNYFLPMHDISVHDNLFTNIGNEPETLGDAQVIQLGAQGHYSFLYNTVTSSQPSGGICSDLAQETNVPAMQQIEFLGNIIPFNKLGFYDEHGHGNLWDAVDNNWNMNRSFTKNVIVNLQNVASQPMENLYTPSDRPPFSGQKACTTCVSTATFDPGVGFVNYSGGDYHLSSSSPYYGWWAHGRSAGADVDQVNWSTAQALAGRPNSFLDFKIRSLLQGRTSASIGYTSYDAAACVITVSTRPDLATVAFTGGDSAGDRDRTISINPLSPGTRYFYSLACDGYTRSGQFLTNP